MCFFSFVVFVWLLFICEMNSNFQFCVYVLVFMCVCVQSLVNQMEQEARVMDAIKYVQAERERGWILAL